VVPQGTTDGNAITGRYFRRRNYQIGGGAANQGAVYTRRSRQSALGNLVNMVPSPDAIASSVCRPNARIRYAGVINIFAVGTNRFMAAHTNTSATTSNATNFANANTGKPAFKQNQYA
jgi:hypothetical protein